MSEDPNIFDPGEWERSMGPARGTRLGAQAGCEQLGAAIYELDAGAQAAPYHLHHANEELLIVLEGELELRTSEGLRTVPAGALVAFVAGPDGAHRVRNVSVRALATWSSRPCAFPRSPSSWPQAPCCR